jgi:chromosome partitioning protein
LKSARDVENLIRTAAKNLRATGKTPRSRRSLGKAGGREASRSPPIGFRSVTGLEARDDRRAPQPERRRRQDDAGAVAGEWPDAASASPDRRGPAGSALDWSQQRSREGLPRLFGVVGLARDTLHREAPELAAMPITSSSTARRVAGLMRSALLAADLVLIPVQPSPLDGWASAEMLALLRKRASTAPSLSPASCSTAARAHRPRPRDGRDAGRSRSAGLAATIGQRIVFAAAAQTGRLAAELDDATSPPARSRRSPRTRPSSARRERTMSERPPVAASPPGRPIPINGSRLLKARRAHPTPGFTARLTIDVTPELRGRIKIAAFGAASPSPTCCANCSRANSPDRRRPIVTARGPSARGGPMPSALSRDDMTHVELTWIEKKIETGSGSAARAHEQMLDRRRRMSFLPAQQRLRLRPLGGNDFGTIISRIDIVRAVEPASLPDAALRAAGRRHPAQDRGLAEGRGVLRHVDAIEAIGIDADAVSPDHWRHVHNRMAAAQRRAPIRSNSIAPSSCAGRS